MRRRDLLSQTIAQFFGPLYENEPHCQILAEILGPETQIDDAGCRLCIPAANITVGRNVVFKTGHHPEYERDHALKIWRFAAATAATRVPYGEETGSNGRARSAHERTTP
jgi:patatin-like phospholipase/acyl hydrolase